MHNAKQRDNFENQMISLKWNRCDSCLEPPGTCVWVMTFDLKIHKGVRNKYSSCYTGVDYVDYNTKEKLGRVLYWAYI